MVVIKVTKDDSFYKECDVCGHVWSLDNTLLRCLCTIKKENPTVNPIHILREEMITSAKKKWAEAGQDQDDVLPDDPDFWGL